jgi:hypothetical protein
MLNSLIAMRLKSVWLVVLYLTIGFGLIAASGYQEEEPQVYILSPLPGEAVQGVVQIMGTTQIEGFSSYELAFSFRDDPTSTWFLISQGPEPIENGLLGQWDTSPLTDGFYRLRLIVWMIEGDPHVVYVDGIRVRNYTPIETSTPTITPTPEPIPPTPVPVTATPTLYPTPTQLAENKASVTPEQITSAVQIGGIIAVVFLFILGLYTTARNRS